MPISNQRYALGCQEALHLLTCAFERPSWTELNLFHGSCGGYTGNICANTRLGIPALKMNDGPQGFRGAASTSTAFPAALTVGATWSVQLAQRWGEAMGDEFFRKGANVQLGPGLCLARVPRNGRTFEYVSGEDPYLGYHLGAAVVSGIQSKGVVANAKHWVNNNQETDRHFISENVDERSQFELYYPPFEGAIRYIRFIRFIRFIRYIIYMRYIRFIRSIPPFEGAIRAGLGSVMCSYNLIGQGLPAGHVGNWSCENSDTLRRDLKGRLGFDG